MTRAAPAASLLASALIIFAACAGEEGLAPVTTLDARSPETEAAALSTVGTAAAPGQTRSESGARVAENLPLDFEITLYTGQDLLNGTEVLFSEVVAMGQPVVLNFWGGLCIPCRAEMSSLQEIYEEYRDDVLVVGLDVGAFTKFGKKSDALELMDIVGTNYPTGATSNREVLAAYGVVGIPFTSFIKPDGSTLLTWTGFMNWGKVRELVQRLTSASIE